MLKKILAVALAAAMIFGLASTAFAAAAFPDIAGVTNGSVITRLKALGIVLGDETGKFNPNNPINRAEFTAMVVRMLGLEAAAAFLNTPTLFADVKADFSWAYGYINIATGRGLIQGYPDGTFGPAANVTQAEALTILLRAAGYTDNLPGNWPIDYVMKGATLDIIETGFSADVAATRALVASLVNNTLDVEVVKENVDHVGQFDLQNISVYEDSFSVTADGTYVSGKVFDVDTDDDLIYIGAVDADYTVASGVVIYGKDTLAALEGQYVKATFNDDDEIVFITVTTKQEVVGDITAVDTVGLKATVGGTAYTLLSTAEVYKNGDLLTDGTTVAGALVAVKDASAVLLLNSDGKVYRVNASILDKEGYIDYKTTGIAADGTATNYVTTKTGDVGTFAVTSDTTIIRNGASATFADLKADDQVEFSINGTDLVYIDAFNNEVEGYKITSYVSTSTGANILTTKDSVATTFAVALDDNDDPMVTLANILALGPLGTSFDLTLGRDGKVTGVALHTATGPVTAKVKTIASKDQYLDDDTPTYRFTFTDGSSISLSAAFIADLEAAVTTRNGIALANNLAATIWNAAEAGDLYLLTDADDDDLFVIELYAPSVSGWMFHDDTGAPTVFAVAKKNYTAPYDAADNLAVATTTWSTPITVNGDAVLNTDVEDWDTPDGTQLVTFTFGGTSSVKLTGIKIEKFASATSYPVKSITSTEDGYVFDLDLNAGSDNPAIRRVITDEDTIVMKGGVAVTAADVKIGDLILADVLNTPPAGVTVNAYVKAAADTTKPSVVTTAGADEPVAQFTEVGAGATDTLVVTFHTSEACRKGYVWVGSTKYEATFSNADDHWTTATILVNGDPGTVTISVTDYAGNVSTSVDEATQ